MKAIEYNSMFHKNASKWFPIDKRLLFNSNLQGRDNNFEDGNLIMINDHNLLSLKIKSSESIIDIVLMKHFKMRKTK